MESPQVHLPPNLFENLPENPLENQLGNLSENVAENPLTTLEKKIHRDIPVAKFMGVQVLGASSSHVTLAAPLGPNNTNHQNTAFGGSVYSVAVLSCLVLANQALHEWGYDIDYVVVQDGHMDYTIPVGNDFEAQSSWASEREAEKFRSMLKRKGVARANFISTVRSQGRDCATMEARFAARIEPKTKSSGVVGAAIL